MRGAKKNPLKFDDPSEFPMSALEKIITEKDRLCLWKKPFDKKDLAKARFSLDAQPKPNGVWYGCGLSWIYWLQSEMPEWLSHYLYKITFDREDILKISTIKQLDIFSAKFGNSRDWGNGSLIDTISWHKVGDAGYRGIEICPYLWKRRFTDNSHWYYGWDVASGCIWDTGIIIKVEEITLDE